MATMGEYVENSEADIMVTLVAVSCCSQRETDIMVTLVAVSCCSQRGTEYKKALNISAELIA
jgi:hypothetical protein